MPRQRILLIIAGGIAATIGNAHAVEDLIIGQSIVVGNTVHEIDGVGQAGYTIANIYPQDVFSGSVFEFRSAGYNRIGVIDFSQILVPVGEPAWETFSRKHYPKAGDEDGVAVPVFESTFPVPDPDVNEVARFTRYEVGA